LGAAAPPVGGGLLAGTGRPGEQPIPSEAVGGDDRYWVTTWNTAKMTTVLLTAPEARALPRATADFLYDPAGGEIRVVRPSGRVIPGSSGLPGGGPITLSIPFGLMTRPDRRMPPLELSRLVGVRSLRRGGIFSQRLQVARRAFGEGGRKGGEPIHFLCSTPTPYFSWWNPECSFMVVEPESWLELARQHPGQGPVLFHRILFGEARIPD
jgi:hypothetical protein